MAQKRESRNPLMQNVLVVGGCGSFGYHLVRHLLRDGDCGSVHVLDRNVEVNRHSDATYTQGSISNADAVYELVHRIKPLVIFHAASPPAALPAHLKKDFYETNVKGTEILLTVATECDAVKAFVYSSTVDVYANPPHVNVDETSPIWLPFDKTAEYSLTKAIADRLVLASNGPRLRTVCLRPGHMYGERYNQGLPEVLDSIKGSAPLVQIGAGHNLMEVASGDNCAAGHILAAKALVDDRRNATTAGKVDGEAFNISDGAPVPFWHHIRTIWGVVRGEEALRKVTVLPVWLVAPIVFIAEWLFWVFTFGSVDPPPALRGTTLSYCTMTHTYSIQKARDRLGFTPVVDHDRVLAESVQWELNRRRLEVVKTR